MTPDYAKTNKNKSTELANYKSTNKDITKDKEKTKNIISESKLKPNPKGAQELDWARIRARLPMDKTPEQQEHRKALFRQIDANGNGILSLAELDRGICDVLQCEEIFAAKPAIARAFHAAKRASQSKNKGSVDDD